MAQPADTRPPWWRELGRVLPRTMTYAAGATRRDAATGLPPLSGNPLSIATVAIDELAMSTAYLLSRRAAAGVSAAAPAEADAAVALLDRAGVVADPRLAHPPPPLPTAVRLTRRQRPGLDFEHVSFVSHYAPPVALPGADDWGGEAANRSAHAYLLRRDRAPRPWVLVLHGHRMGEPRDLRLLGSRRLQRDLDVNVAHLVLPMHGPRGRGGHRSFPGVDPVANFLGVAQAVWDARSLLAWLRTHDAGPIGVHGVSLGGHVAAMLAGLDADLAAVVTGVPTSDIATMLADTMRVRWGQEAVDESHVQDPSFRTLSRLVSPLAFPAAVDRDRLAMFAAVGDRLITPEQALALWEHWRRPPILWLQGAHILNNLGASRRFVVDALSRCGVTGRREGQPCAS
jgi:hypothetical protein